MAHDAIQSRRNFDLLRVEFRRIALQHRVHDFDCGVAAEGLFAGEHLVEHGAEAEDVGAMVDRLAAHLLRRHVWRGAHHHAGLGLQSLHRGHGEIGQTGRCFRHCRADIGLGESEVEELGVTVFGEEDVFRLEVAMYDAALVRCRQTVRDLQTDLDRLANPERTAIEALAQRLALQQLHDEIRRLGLHADVEHGENVGMIKRGDGARFLLEALHAHRDRRRGLRGES